MNPARPRSIQRRSSPTPRLLSEALNPKLLCKLAERVLRHATAPYYEHAVRAETEKILTEAGVPFRRDRFGNVLARLQTAPRQRPLVLAAHLDHPGFEILPPPPITPADPHRAVNSSPQLYALFRGGVPETYFTEGTPVRLMPGSIKASLGKPAGQAKTYFLNPSWSETPARKLAVRKPLPFDFAVWDLEDFALRGGRIHARACDDLVGAACILGTMLELKRIHAPINLLGVFSRAEEVGFHGAPGPGRGPRHSSQISRDFP